MSWGSFSCFQYVYLLTRCKHGFFNTVQDSLIQWLPTRVRYVKFLVPGSDSEVEDQGAEWRRRRHFWRELYSQARDFPVGVKPRRLRRQIEPCANRKIVATPLNVKGSSGSSDDLLGSDIRWMAMPVDVTALNVDISAPSRSLGCSRPPPAAAGTCWVTWPDDDDESADCEQQTRAWNDVELTTPSVDWSVSLTLFDTSHISIWTTRQWRRQDFISGGIKLTKFSRS